MSTKESLSIQEQLFPPEERITTDEQLGQFEQLFLQGRVSYETIVQTDSQILKEIFFLSEGIKDRVERANEAVRRALLGRQGKFRGRLCILLQQILPRYDGLYSCLHDTNEARRLMNYKKNMMRVAWAMGKGEETRPIPPALE